MTLEELPEEHRTCENCSQTQCAGRGTDLRPRNCVFWVESPASVWPRAEKRIAELEREVADHAEWAKKFVTDPANSGAVDLVKRIAELERERDEVRHELIGNLRNQMLRCSDDTTQAYIVPSDEDVAIECDTTCGCPGDCPVYQRWLGLCARKGGA
jgi:hypothetical protein